MTKPTNGDLRHTLSNSAAQLLSVVERIERLEEEQAGLADDKKEVYSEAKGNGFDTATIRRVIAWRKKDPSKREEADEMFDLYSDSISQAEKAQTAKSVEDGA